MINNSLFDGADCLIVFPNGGIVYNLRGE